MKQIHTEHTDICSFIRFTMQQPSKQSANNSMRFTMDLTIVKQKHSFKLQQTMFNYNYEVVVWERIRFVFKKTSLSFLYTSWVIMEKRRNWKNWYRRSLIFFMFIFSGKQYPKNDGRTFWCQMTVSNIQKRKDVYLERYNKECRNLQCKWSNTLLDEVNEAMLCWFKQMRAVNTRISGPMIHEIAKMFTNKLRVSHFQASTDWLKKFKLWHKISPKVLCGESKSQ